LQLQRAEAAQQSAQRDCVSARAAAVADCYRDFHPVAAEIDSLVEASDSDTQTAGRQVAILAWTVLAVAVAAASTHMARQPVLLAKYSQECLGVCSQAPGY